MAQPMIRRGEQGEYRWVETGLPESRLSDLVVPLHTGYRLAVTAFDGGPIRPDPEEQEPGWRVVGQAMVSPPLQATTEIPEAGFDEWYVFDSLPPETWTPECFVSY